MTRIAIIGGHGKVALHLSALLTKRGTASRPSSATRTRPPTSRPPARRRRSWTLKTRRRRKSPPCSGTTTPWSGQPGQGEGTRSAPTRWTGCRHPLDGRGGGSRGRPVCHGVLLRLRPGHGVPKDNGFFAYAEAKAAADEYLRGTGLDWTILCPGPLTNGPGTGLIDVNPDAPWQSADASRANVAIVAAAVLELPGSAGKTIEFRDGTLPVAAALDLVK